MNNGLSKKRKVMNYLMSGRPISGSQARHLYDVQNIRATMSDIKEQVERYGNLRIVTSQNSNGTTQYQMKRVVLADPAQFA